MAETNNPDLKQVSTYVDKDTYNRLEKARGRISRSAFVANILEEVFSNFPEQEA